MAKHFIDTRLDVAIPPMDYRMIVLYPSLDLLCGTVYRLNFGPSTVVLHFVDG